MSFIITIFEIIWSKLMEYKSICHRGLHKYFTFECIKLQEDFRPVIVTNSITENSGFFSFWMYTNRVMAWNNKIILFLISMCLPTQVFHIAFLVTQFLISAVENANISDYLRPLWLLTHWGRVTHICVGSLAIIGSDNGLSPDRRQAMIWTNAGILIIRILEIPFREIFFEIH